MSGSPVVGIDLGTTFSAVAHVNQVGKPEIITNSEGARTTPSVIYFEEGGPPVVGAAARNIALSDPERTVQFIKREMGNSSYRKTFDGKEYLPESISALILRKLKADAEARLGGELARAVISVPAYFMDAQKTATRTAGELAGLVVSHTVNEPTAAAIAYGFGRPDVRQTVLVYDFGGGTFDVTVLKIDGSEFLVLSTFGDAHLGGIDVDNRVVDYLAEQYQTHRGTDLRSDPFTRLDLWERAETAKKDLSTRQSAVVSLGTGANALRVDLDRARFAELIADLVDKTRACMDNALDAANLRWADIDNVLLVGGSSRIAAVREMIKKTSDKELGLDLNPDEVVALGAAVRANLDEVHESVRTPVPSAGAPASSTKDTNEVGIVVRDVAPHSLGVRAFDAAGRPINSVIIRRLTEVPCERQRTYATRAAGQRKIEVEILQGENPDPFSPEVESIGRLVMDDLPDRPAGEVLVTLTLRYDADGVVEVEAQELVGGQRVHGQLLRKSGELDEEFREILRRDLDELENLPQVAPDPPSAPPVAGSPAGGETPGPNDPTPEESFALRGPDAPSEVLAADFPVVPGTDLYGFVGVPPDAGFDEIESAVTASEGYWRDKRDDPELQEERDVAEVALDTLGEAREVLLDPISRAAYDARPAAGSDSAEWPA